MNTPEKKELLMKLANELTDELADDEKLFLACSFNDYDNPYTKFVLDEGIVYGNE